MMLLTSANGFDVVWEESCNRTLIRSKGCMTIVVINPALSPDMASTLREERSIVA